MQVGDMKRCCWLGAKHVALLHALCVLGLSVGNASGEAGVPRSMRLHWGGGGRGGVLGLCLVGTVKASVHPGRGPLPHFTQAFIEHFLIAMIHMDVAFLGWLTLVPPGAC